MGQKLCLFFGCGSDRKNNHSPDERVNKKSKNDLIRFFMTGLGSAGKTTIIRQLLLLSKEKDHYKLCDDQWNEVKNAPDEGNEFWLRTVRTNVVDALDLMVKKLQSDGEQLPEEFAEFANQLNDILERDDDDTHESDSIMGTDHFREQVIQLFEQDQIQHMWERRNKVRVDNRKLFDGCDHFMNVEKIEAIFRPNYQVTQKDKLHARRPTKDMHTYRFRINNFDLEINDVGGQKSELRKVVDFLRKWSLESEATMNYILLVVPVSDFDVDHDEYEDRTLLDECVEYMKLLMNNPVAQNCGLFIFFNKADRFWQKLNDPECRDSIKYLEEHLSAQQVSDFRKKGRFVKDVMRDAVTEKFAEAIREIPNRDHNTSYRFTCAVDSRMMEGLFSAIKTEAIQKSFIDYIP